MPIRQPKQRTIYTSEFLEKAYCFTVESTLGPQERTGLLMLSVSTGYLLTTSFSEEPKREQTFNYVQQSNGNWLATGQVTLTTIDDSPSNGTIVIRSPFAETVVLPIEATSGAIVLSEKTYLTVSESTLIFPQTSSGKPSFRILTIAQKPNGLSAPVTLTTNAPEHFQLATDSRPTFSPSLTLTPSSLGTYVHVRYSAGKSGSDKGQLTILSEYEERKIDLEGRSSSFLPSIRTLAPVTPIATLRRPNWSSVSRGLPLLVALAISIGLAYTGYSNRCQFFPALCNDNAISKTTLQNKIVTPILTNSEKITLSTETVKRSKTKEVTLMPVNRPINSATRPVLGQSAKLAKSDRRNKENGEEDSSSSSLGSQIREKSINKNPENQTENRTSRRTVPASALEESELEQVLNKKQ